MLAVLTQELIPKGNVLALLQPWEFPASVILAFVVTQLSEDYQDGRVEGYGAHLLPQIYHKYIYM